MNSLELTSTEDLLLELRKRYTALVILGAVQEDPAVITEVVDGPAYMCAGLLHQASCQITASMTKPLEEDD